MEFGNTRVHVLKQRASEIWLAWCSHGGGRRAADPEHMGTDLGPERS